MMAAISFGERSSEISNCSNDCGSTAYPPGLVLEPALMLVTPNLITWFRNFSSSRVEIESSTSGLKIRYAQINCTNSLSLINEVNDFMEEFSCVPTSMGLNLGKEMLYLVCQ